MLASPENPTQKTVLVGRAHDGGMIILFEIEPAKSMWMPMTENWVEHAPAATEKFHLEVKPIDPASQTRISYAQVRFAGHNQDNDQRVEGLLHPMWGGSGLHYAMNSALAGDGRYRAQISVGVPTFARSSKDRQLWTEPVTAHFHFRLQDGQLVEISEPDPEP